MTTLIFGTVLPWLLMGLGAWLAFQLVRQNGRLLLRLEAIEKRLTPRTETKRPAAAGLPAGTLAPDFDLPDLTGVRHKLSEFRGKNAVLIFFNPSCGFCSKMAADLAALRAEVDNRHHACRFGHSRRSVPTCPVKRRAATCGQPCRLIAERAQSA